MVSSSTSNASTKTVNPSTNSDRVNAEIEKIASDLSGDKTFLRNLLHLAEDNAQVIINYITVVKTEVNYSINYGTDTIGILCRFSRFHKNKPFKEITRDHIIEFLDSPRKTETQDPYHKWIGTYNVYRMYLLRFFRWLYSPNLEHGKRPKPSVMENIPKLKRKEISTYKPSDLWTPQDDILFLKYCPSKRDKFYHAVSRDSSARPHEILKLKIKDVSFKSIGSSQYAEVVVNGKTGTRKIPLINSIPYLKDYLSNEHPQPGNPNSPLISGEGKSLGRHMNPGRIYQKYAEYKEKIFPKLLESPNVTPEDRPLIRELLTKRWNPYVRRHTALTEKAKILKEPILKMHGGWTQKSQTHLKYEHWFGNEHNESLLEAYGLLDKGIQIDQLKPKQCPNCNEPNKIDSRFCSKCKMILSYDAYEETLENQKEKEDRLTTIENRFNTMQLQIHSLLSSLGSMQDQNQVNQLAKTLFDSKILNQTSGP
jgi:integrase/recombinase XerD